MSVQQELSYLKKQKNINLNFCRGFIEDGTNRDANGSLIANNFRQIAMDAALTTSPNITVPVQLLSYWEPKAIKVLTAKRSATDIFPEVKKGKFSDQKIFFKQLEEVGSTKPYSDFSNSGRADINYNFPSRDNYRFQDFITIGDLENEMLSEAKISLVSDKQMSAATAIAIDTNKYYLFGVSGREIFGILNDPDALPAIAPLTVNTNQTKWANKTTQQRYNDVLELFKELSGNLGGLVNQNSNITLAISPTLNVMLGAATDFNVSVLDMLNKFFQHLRLVIVPELESSTSQTMMMIVDEVMGQRTGECVSSEKFRTYQPYRKHSSLSQKLAGATSGAVIYNHAAVAIMEGM